jgi:lipopolysaccharide biosynthesis glycosyltransferase
MNIHVEPVRVFIGTEPAQLLAEKVLAHSIRANAAGPVEIHSLTQDEARVGGTNFGFVRFKIPQLCDFRGKAIYLDADQLVLGDIGELWNCLDGEHAVALVNSAEGNFGGKAVTKANQTSVMVLDCAKLADWKTPDIFGNVVANDKTPGPGQMRYRDFMQLSWIDQALIQPLPPEWNHFNICNDRTRLVHFSHVRSQPWRKPSHALSAFWRGWLEKAVKEGSLTRAEIRGEVLKRHVSWRLFPHMFGAA